MTAREIVEMDKEALYIGNTRTVEFDLKLPVKGTNGSDIRWVTGHDRIIGTDGKVTRPKFGMGTRIVKLTAIISFEQEEAVREFEVRVLEEENKIIIKKVHPMHLAACAGSNLCLPGAAIVDTEDGKTIAHETDWDGGGEVFCEKPGTMYVKGLISGTKVPVCAEVEVKADMDSGIVKEEPKIEVKPKWKVRLSVGSFFYRAQGWFEEFLLSVNNDQMLYSFRDAAGLDKKGAPEMIGWDAPDSKLRGHTTGHYLSALALCYHATGNTKIADKAHDMVQSLRECQVSLVRSRGCKKGFLSAYLEEQFDQLEQYVRYPEIWAPYYTLHKILAGLLDCYEYIEDMTAMQMADELGEWVYNRLSACTRRQRNKMWSLYIAGEYGGMNDAMARLYAYTGKPHHLEAAGFFDNDQLFYPLKEKVDVLDGVHANQHIPQIAGCMKLFEATGEKRYHDIAEFFWKAVTEAHSYVIGGTGEGEMFHEPGKIGRQLTKNTAESCASYNMLKLTQELYKYHPDVSYADYYERTLYNHIAASCEHAPTGGSTYFMPLAPGYNKDFEDENSCCHGSGLESHFKYGDAIYAKAGQEIFVNLFIPSVLEWEDGSLMMETETDMPSKVHIEVEAASRMGYVLKVRRPYWSRLNSSLTVDGVLQKAETDAHGYFTVPCDKGNTHIFMEFECRPYLEEVPDVKGLVSIMYGPYVMAALTEEDTFLELPFHAKNLEDELKPDGELSLVYEKAGIRFVPLSRICHEKYQVYFKIV
nr:beta-L-arabinofuranosidase domain-containing protein [uncultured Clostridium sp.]